MRQNEFSFGWVGANPRHGLVWTKRLWLVNGLCEGSSSYNGVVLAVKFNVGPCVLLTICFLDNKDTSLRNTQDFYLLGRGRLWTRGL
eukprot:3600427-Amphidinium_carterae.1